MKKIAIVLSVALCLALGSCKKSTPVPEMIKLMDQTTEKIEKAKDTQAVEEISTQFAAELEKLKDDYPDYEPTEEEKTQIIEASMRMATAASQAYTKDVTDATADAMREAADQVDTEEQ